MAEDFRPNRHLEILIGGTGFIGGVLIVGHVEDGYSNAHDSAQQHIQNLQIGLHAIQVEEGDAKNTHNETLMRFVSVHAARQESQITQLVAQEPKAPNNTTYNLEGAGIGVGAGLIAALATRGASRLVHGLQARRNHSRSLSRGARIC